MRSEAWLRHRPALLMAAHAACFWPVWHWYTARLFDGSDEPWGMVALAAAIAITWPRGRGLRLDPADPLWKWAAGFTVLYALATPFAPPMIRALLAIAAIACSWSSLSGSRGALPLVSVLFALSLPIIASLQFYLGYPLRAITAAGASELLGLVGYDIQRVGTAMAWQNRIVLVDAPCSGVRMLWAGAFLTCILFARKPTVHWMSLGAALALVLPAVLMANSARAAALFILEIQPMPRASLVHALVGLGTFLLLGLAIVSIQAVVASNERRAACAGC